MVGLELPVLAMEHQYIISEDMPELAAAPTGKEMLHVVDFEGEIYMRQERGGILLGTYERAGVPWSAKETPWNFGTSSCRTTSTASRPTGGRLRALPGAGDGRHHAGHQRPLHLRAGRQPAGRPDPRPARLLGRLRRHGRLQPGRRRRPRARELDVEGDHGDSGMDSGPWMSPATATGRRSPTPTPRCARTTPAASGSASPTRSCRRPAAPHDADLRPAQGRERGVRRGLRAGAPALVPGAGTPPIEDITFRRSNAFPHVAEEVRTVRERVGLMEISGYAKYEVSGEGAEAYLSSPDGEPDAGAGPDRADADAERRGPDRSATSRSRGRPTPTSSSCSARGRPRSTTCAGSGTTCPPTGRAVRGPGTEPGGSLRRRAAVARRAAAVAPDLDLSTAAFPFMTFREVDLGMIPGHVARINFTGDLGYELWVRPQYQRVLFDRIVAAGRGPRHRLSACGRSSLRLEKSYGTWFREYRPIYRRSRPGSAATSTSTTTSSAARPTSARWRPAPLPDARGDGRRARPGRPADVIGDEPVWHDDEVVGWVTSGGYGHHVGLSVALGYVPTALATPDGAGGERLRDRDHRAPTTGAPPAATELRSGRHADAPVTETSAGGGPSVAEAAGRIVVDGRPLAFEPGDSVALAVLAWRRAAGSWRDAVPRRGLPELPRDGGRHRLRPDVPGRRAGRGWRWSGIRTARTRHSPSSRNRT